MEVEPGSPAAIAGLRPNDTIIGFQGQPIATVDDLHKRLVAEAIGVPSPLMLLRGTGKLFCTVVPRELPAPRRPLEGDALSSSRFRLAFGGAVVAAAASAVSQYHVWIHCSNGCHL